GYARAVQRLRLGIRVDLGYSLDIHADDDARQRERRVNDRTLRVQRRLVEGPRDREHSRRTRSRVRQLLARRGVRDGAVGKRVAALARAQLWLPTRDGTEREFRAVDQALRRSQG